MLKIVFLLFFSFLFFTLLCGQCEFAIRTIECVGCSGNSKLI